MGVTPPPKKKRGLAGEKTTRKDGTEMEENTPGKKRKGHRGGQKIPLTITATEEVRDTSNVLNLSDRVLTPHETSLLSEGLNFCPNRHFNFIDTILVVNTFVKNLTIKKHYYAANDDLVADLCTSNDMDNSTTVFTFRELLQLGKIRILEDLESTAHLSVEGGNCLAKSSSLKIRSEFYPVNSCTPDMS